MLIQLKEYLEEHNLLYKSQYGFRENHSTAYAVLELIDHISNNFDNGIVPFSKAFDTLNHTILTQKLKHYGIKDCALKVLKNYLSNRKFPEFPEFPEYTPQAQTIPHQMQGGV